MAWNDLTVRAGGTHPNYFHLSRFFIDKAEGPALLTCPATLSPACASPSAAVAGSAKGSITHVNPSTGGPLTYPPSSAVPGLMFLTFPAAWPGSTFAPPSTASLGLTYAGTNAQVFFWAEITPGNAFADAHFTLGHST